MNATFTTGSVQVKPTVRVYIIAKSETKYSRGQYGGHVSCMIICHQVIIVFLDNAKKTFGKSMLSKYAGSKQAPLLLLAQYTFE